MRDRIETHVLDLLQSDPRLIQGGSAWEAGWLGVTRPCLNGQFQAGYVNLFDTTYDRAGVDHRPAVYLGTEAMELTDRLDYVTCSAVVAGNRVEYRELMLPLVIAIQVQGAGGKYPARQQRNQLTANIETILLGHPVEPGYWYEMTAPGVSGGGAAIIRFWASATGSNAQADAEAMAIFPLRIKYSFQAGAA